MGWRGVVAAATTDVLISISLKGSPFWRLRGGLGCVPDAYYGTFSLLYHWRSIFWFLYQIRFGCNSWSSAGWCRILLCHQALYLFRSSVQCRMGLNGRHLWSLYGERNMPRVWRVRRCSVSQDGCACGFAADARTGVLGRAARCCSCCLLPSPVCSRLPSVLRTGLVGTGDGSTGSIATATVSLLPSKHILTFLPAAFGTCVLTSDLN